MKFRRIIRRAGLTALAGLLFGGTAMAADLFQLATIKNNTDYSASGTVEYEIRPNDSYPVRPGETWRAKSRSGCPITGTTGRLSGKAKYG